MRGRRALCAALPPSHQMGPIDRTAATSHGATAPAAPLIPCHVRGGRVQVAIIGTCCTSADTALRPPMHVDSACVWQRIASRGPCDAGGGVLQRLDVWIGRGWRGVIYGWDRWTRRFDSGVAQPGAFCTPPDATVQSRHCTGYDSSIVHLQRCVLIPAGGWPGSRVGHVSGQITTCEF